MSLIRTLSDGQAGSPTDPPREEAQPAQGRGGAGWMDRFLPARGFERKSFLVLAVLVLALKVLAIYNFRADSDETQHAHVVWGWVTGQLQYRDLFDNHMPLFQMAWAPVMAMIGERADIIMMLRWTVVPFYLICLWAVYRLTEVLYSRRAAPWAALFAATFRLFFYTSTEFRTDDLWAVFWLLSLVVAVSGQFTLRRAIEFGLLLGLAFAVSLKTVALLIALGTATAITMLLAWWRGGQPGLGKAVVRVVAIVTATVIPPAATVLYFAWRGAFWIMYYCVVVHNVVPRLKRWGDFSLHQWYFPLALAPLAAYGWLTFRQTADTRLAIRRTIIALTPWFFLILLWSYWPDITREDDLPYTPLLPLALMPLLVLAGGWVRNEKWRRNFWTYGLPALGLCNLAFTMKAQNLREDRLRVTEHAIADVLEITKPDDYVMENKGDYVFRRRAYYWVLEPITKARVRMGLIRDSIPQGLTEKGVKVCYFYCGHAGSLASQFIVANYVPVDPEAVDIGVLGKVIGSGSKGGDFSFDVTIPQTYAVVTEKGQVAGDLDGKPYTEPVWLAPGSHEFRRTQGTGRVGILLKDAYVKGFTLLFDSDDWIVQRVGTLPPERQAKGPEVQ